MERSSGFDDDDDEEEFGGGRRDGASQKELAGKSDGKGGNMSDQRPSTPRSKHSVTEQRRRSKINDRFQILRDLIPHSDQKRDRASFLLEVIEYVRFLQEKVQKYEESYPGWTEENAKSTPWVKVYFRSFWNNARNSQGLGDGIADPSQVLKNGSVPASFTFSGNDNSVPVAPAILSAEQNPTESDLTGIVVYKATENSPDFANKVAGVAGLQPELRASSGRGIGVAQSQQLASDSDNLASQSKSQWLRPPCAIDCTVAGDILNEGEELAIDEGTISVSNTYSQELLTTLSQALQNSGINLSQATVSVQINLGKRATNKRPASTTISNAKDYDDDPSSANQTKVENCGDESEQACKRSKSNNSPC